MPPTVFIYVYSGNVNDHLVAFERSLNEEEASEDVDEVAKTMMVFMVRGLFTRLRFPYAQFACQSVSGELLFHPFWQAVYRLERMCFKVCLSCANSFYVIFSCRCWAQPVMVPR